MANSFKSECDIIINENYYRTKIRRANVKR